MVKTYRDLIIWQKAMQFVTDIYRASKSFPKDELYGLSAQVRRCAVSIPSNIAEGYARNSTSDYIRFLRIAAGSLYELQTQIEIAFRLDYLDKDSYTELNDRGWEMGRMLGSMINKLDNGSLRNPAKDESKPQNHNSRS